MKVKEFGTFHQRLCHTVEKAYGAYVTVRPRALARSPRELRLAAEWLRELADRLGALRASRGGWIFRRADLQQLCK